MLTFSCLQNRIKMLPFISKKQLILLPVKPQILPFKLLILDNRYDYWFRHMTYKYIIIDGDSQSSTSIQTHVATLGDFLFSGYANNASEGLNLVLEENPDIVFLGTNLVGSTSESDFTLINELYKYMILLPKIVIVSGLKEIAYDAMKLDVYDFILKPFQKIEIIKTILKFKKEQGFLRINNHQDTTIHHEDLKVETSVVNNEFSPQSFVNNGFSALPELNIEQENQKEITKIDVQFDTEEIKNELLELVKHSLSEKSLPVNIEAEQSIEQKNNILCIKSYGDYRFVEFDDIVYLKADNNSTDIVLNTGDSITAFKTLKHFEGTLPSEFMRIHNSHIVNINFVSRIHLGNSDCYLNKGKIKLPFSKSYKDNINTILELYAHNESKED